MAFEAGGDGSRARRLVRRQLAETSPPLGTGWHTSERAVCHIEKPRALLSLVRKRLRQATLINCECALGVAKTSKRRKKALDCMQLLAIYSRKTKSISTCKFHLHSIERRKSSCTPILITLKTTAVTMRERERARARACHSAIDSSASRRLSDALMRSFFVRRFEKKRARSLATALATSVPPAAASRASANNELAL